MQPKAYSRSVGMLEAFAVVPIGMCGAKARRLNFTVPSASRKVAGLSSTDQPHQWDGFRQLAVLALRWRNFARDLFDDVT